MAKKEAVKEAAIAISPPNFQRIQLTLEGTAPLMQARFSAKAMQAMMATGEARRGEARRGYHNDLFR